MWWIQGRLRPTSFSDAEQQILENWVRLRFQLAGSDAMLAIIGAVSRLTAAGMDREGAMQSVLRILKEFEPIHDPGVEGEPRNA
jgi:hypothetical protein